MPLNRRSQILATLGWLLPVWCACAARSPGPEVPAAVDVAIYLPEHLPKFQPDVKGLGAIHIQEGRTLSQGVLSVGRTYFPAAHLVDPAEDTHFGLLIAIHVAPTTDRGNFIYTMSYTAYGADRIAVLTGSHTMTQSLAEMEAGGDVIGRITQQLAGQAMADIVAKLQPTPAKFPPTANLASQELAFAADHEKPWSTGTGFFLNAAGQVMTTAQVTRNCLEVRVRYGEQDLHGTVVARSDLVDLAVLDTGARGATFLPLRRAASYEAGPPVLAVDYSRESLPSADFIQGITVGSPGNAVYARYAEMFLRKNNVEFTAVDPKPRGDSHDASEATTNAVVRVMCYE